MVPEIAAKTLVTTASRVSPMAVLVGVRNDEHYVLTLNAILQNEIFSVFGSFAFK